MNPVLSISTLAEYQLLTSVKPAQQPLGDRLAGGRVQRQVRGDADVLRRSRRWSWWRKLCRRVLTVPMVWVPWTPLTS